jgi:hypothetical protein
MCARGNKKAYDIHYMHLWLDLVLVAKFNLHVCQGDVPSAYVKADLKESVHAPSQRVRSARSGAAGVAPVQSALRPQAGRPRMASRDRLIPAKTISPTVSR